MADEKTTFLEVSPGNQSSGRLYVLLLILTAILFSGATLAAGLYKYLHCSNTESLPVIATAATGVLVTVSGVALSFKAYTKKDEAKP